MECNNVIVTRATPTRVLQMNRHPRNSNSGISVPGHGTLTIVDDQSTVPRTKVPGFESQWRGNPFSAYFLCSPWNVTRSISITSGVIVDAEDVLYQRVSILLRNEGVDLVELVPSFSFFGVTIVVLKNNKRIGEDESSPFLFCVI